MRFHKEIIICIVLFILALAIRVDYQSESVVNGPLRADASEYFSAAYNLRFHGVFSQHFPRLKASKIERPTGSPPNSRTTRSPVYPLFQATFMSEGKSVSDFIRQVLMTQAIMGALVAVFVFLIAGMLVPCKWAALAGVLTAISPHLVALDGYMLSESLFIFTITLATLLLAQAWKTDHLLLTLIGGLLLALSFQIRALSVLAPIFVAATFLFAAQQKRLRKKSSAIKHVLILISSLLLVVAAHMVFVDRYVMNSDNIQMEQQKRVSFTKSLDKYFNNIKPPNFYVENKSHVYAHHRDEKWKAATQLSFSSIPMKYITWNLWDKFFTIYSWDNAYNEDVYIYPMKRKGFQEGQFLFPLHNLMKKLHIPILLLSVLGVVLLSIRWAKGTLPVPQRVMIIPAIMFVYFTSMLYFLSWLPRYTIPVRPFIYILATVAIVWLIPILKSANWVGATNPNMDDRE